METNLRHQAWEVFNAAFHEGGIVRSSMREYGMAMLNEAAQKEHIQARNELFQKLDAQNELINTALRLRSVRTELSAIQQNICA